MGSVVDFFLVVCKKYWSIVNFVTDGISYLGSGSIIFLLALAAGTSLLFSIAIK